jgi:hypothetical protein
VTRRARARAGEDQLHLDLDETVHLAVERARALRRSLGLPESLACPEVLASVRLLLDPQRRLRRMPSSSAERCYANAGSGPGQSSGSPRSS